ncbi:hypothetical protein EZV77_13895 [Burkholderia thailandensis]|nr:hypothetical protein [Burkholderia thailandensis]MDD1489417.1 hypothetical protein [Burkholderia thailandensis]MDD1495549.1 hypothetical protein [Burkholderia thailandensis]MDW9235314.1 hypothetical protein [Burkholderia thailandensis]PJO70303.1 hypothetical protein CWD92_21705 [Burkholderia thailandensis]
MPLHNRSLFKFRLRDDENALSVTDSVADSECGGVADYRKCGLIRDRARRFLSGAASKKARSAPVMPVDTPR